MKLTRIIFFCTVFSISITAAEKQVDTTLIRIQNEIAALKRMKAEKLDKLETAETRRWNQRYRHNEEMKLLESTARQYEARYTTLAGQQNRKQEDLMLLKQALEDERSKRQDAENSLNSFVFQIRQSVEEHASRIEYDFPYAIAERTAQLSSIQTELQQNNTSIATPLNRFITQKIDRITLARQQAFTTRAVLFGDGMERTAWNLRFGTVLMVDIAKDTSTYQMLMNTGALQGQRYMWKNSISPTFYDETMHMVAALREGAPISLPMDILQNGKIGVADDLTESNTLKDRFKVWFAQGGLIMYPLFLCAIAALLLSLERFLTLTARHHQYRKSYKNLMPLINNGKWEDARNYCTKRCTGLTRAINEIVHRRDGGRTQAEQHVKQILLGEVPALEKRMSIISALGASAPLLGLLGTVSGMITLFKVITQTGTNDARILAGGISEALVTTQTGLLVAIPILLIHGYLNERLEDILSHYNETVLEVFNIVFDGDGKEDTSHDS